jgi:hypothetical protein
VPDFDWGQRGGCGRLAGDACSSVAPGPAFTFVGGPWCPALDFVIAFSIVICVSHIVDFTILYYRLDLEGISDVSTLYLP